jgi:heme O synthase-like polyprenyltransferase
MGRVQPGEALAFGLTLACFAVVVLGLLVNLLAAALLAFTIFFYVVVYTMWHRISSSVMSDRAPIRSSSHRAWSSRTARR